MRFEACEIKGPEGADLVELYRFLGDIFPPDRKLISRLRSHSKPLSHWRPYVLCRGEEILGSVSLFSFNMWHRGSVLPLEGIGWVATAPEFRRQGIARHLMDHALEIVDREGKPSVLFTTIPGAYRGHGFKEVPQSYFEKEVQDLSFAVGPASVRPCARLSAEELEQAAQIYSAGDPPWEGKIIRERGHWNMYRMLFNPYPEPHIGFLEQGGKASGYIRIDLEPDRILISELCTSPGNETGALAMLGFASDFARQRGLERATFALPPGHFAWTLLKNQGVSLRKEVDQKAIREIFMVRPSTGEDLGTLSQLQWPLADKF